MRTLSSIFKILFIPTIIMGLYACDEKECTSDTIEPQLKINFRLPMPNKSGVVQEKDTIVYLRDIKGEGASDDLFRANSFGSIISLSLPKNQDSSIFIFEVIYDKDRTSIDSTSLDTLIVRYKRQPYFVSQACGFKMRYSNLDTIKNTFDKLVIEKNDIDLTTPINIKIYFTQPWQKPEEK